MNDTGYDLRLTEALERLPAKDRIHTFLGALIPLGAEWDRADVETLLMEAGGAWAVGGKMGAMGHTIACRDRKGRIVYIETEVTV